MDYLVSWEINIDADSAEEAAQAAKEILQTQVGPVLDVVDDQGQKTRFDFLANAEEAREAGLCFRTASDNLGGSTDSDGRNNQGRISQAAVKAPEPNPNQEVVEEDRYPICPECLHSLDSIHEFAQCSGCGTSFNSSISELLHLLREDIYTDAKEYADKMQRIRKLVFIDRAPNTI